MWGLFNSVIGGPSSLSELLVVAFSFMFFLCTNRAMQFFKFPRVPHTLDPSLHWKWRNSANSVLHAAIIGPWSFYILLSNPAMLVDLIKPHTDGSLYLLCFTYGYFAYDLINMMTYDRSRYVAELFLHHIIILTCVPIPISIEQYHGAVLLALVCELNSITLHLRGLAKMARVDSNSRYYRIVSRINIVTAIAFRILPYLWLERWTIMIKNLVPFNQYLLAFVGASILNVIQMVLIYRLLMADFFRPSSASEGREKKSKSKAKSSIDSGCSSSSQTHSPSSTPSAHRANHPNSTNVASSEPAQDTDDNEPAMGLASFEDDDFIASSFLDADPYGLTEFDPDLSLNRSHARSRAHRGAPFGFITPDITEQAFPMGSGVESFTDALSKNYESNTRSPTVC